MAIQVWGMEIPNWRPAALNELMGNHGKAGRLKQADRNVVIGYAKLRRIPAAMVKRRVSLTITLPKGQRRWDVDAFQKSVLDACKHAGIIVDDRDLWVEWGGVKYERGARLSTTIIIEESDGTADHPA
jgi:Holliday junction resolvase RusA-like endonuclease